jgi:hypothetical protein
MDQEITENQKLMEEFINDWAQYSMSHPQLTLGEWLKTLSIMTGLAMKMGDMPANQVHTAISQMSDVISDVFDRADEHVVKGTVQ